MSSYYNENDPFAAEWLRQLIAAKQLPAGYVDSRSIEDVLPSDLEGYTQCHFFAGIGGWALALKQAGWPDDRPVWTGSCPCQPFSTAGKGAGTADERHLWPVWYWLISQCCPAVIFGEQVSKVNGLAWLDGVSSDLEGTGYACGAADICAGGIGAPHIRQRLYFVAHSENTRLRERHTKLHGDTREAESSSNATNGLENSQCSASARLRPDSGQGLFVKETDGLTGSGNLVGFWREAKWLYCTDQKYRPVEPGIAPLADGVPARVGRLRGYGNAIVVPQAKALIEAYMTLGVE